MTNANKIRDYLKNQSKKETKRKSKSLKKVKKKREDEGDELVEAIYSSRRKRS